MQTNNPKPARKAAAPKRPAARRSATARRLVYKCLFCGAELKNEQDASDHLAMHMAEQGQKQQEAVAQTYLMLAACQLTQICTLSAKKPEEIVDMFGKTYQLLQSWQGESKQKDQFVRWLQKQWGSPREL